MLCGHVARQQADIETLCSTIVQQQQLQLHQQATEAMERICLTWKSSSLQFLAGGSIADSDFQCGIRLQDGSSLQFDQVRRMEIL